MTRIYRAAVVGCSRMGAFIDNEFVGLPGRFAPHSHAAGYEAHDRTDLVAGVDMRPDVLAQFGQRYGVAESHLYTDYREMLAKEQPDIISVATQPEQRAEIAIYAAEHGVKALYCEKAMCASLQEADAMLAAVERHGVVFNMGTNRRWHPGYAKMRELIASGDLGNLELLLIYNNSALFNSSSHNFDLIQFLNGDEPVIWAQGWVDRGDEIIVGDEVREDPLAEGMFGFANGVTVSVMRGPRGQDYEAVCEDGIITASNQDVDFLVRRRERPGPGAGRRIVLGAAPPHLRSRAGRGPGARVHAGQQHPAAGRGPRAGPGHRRADARRRACSAGEHRDHLRLYRIAPARRGTSLTAPGGLPAASAA